MKILIASSDRDLLSCCAELCRTRGYEVTEAFDRSSAADFAREGGYDAALIDDGLTGSPCDPVKALSKADIPSVVFCRDGLCLSDLTADVMPCGILPLPFSAKRMFEILERIVDLSGRETALSTGEGLVIRGFTLENKVRITSSEADLLLGRSTDDAGTAFVCATALNIKLKKLNKALSVSYVKNIGYRLVADNG